MSKESDEWAMQRRNGTLDDPIDPYWKNPGCCKCGVYASVVVTPCGSRSYGNIELGAPYEKGSMYYCQGHEPTKKSK